MTGQDYRSLQSILRLDPCDEKVCFDVAIINDARVEDMEQFTLSLVYDFGSGGDVKEDKVDIWINDTDGMRLKYLKLLPLSVFNRSLSAVGKGALLFN